MWLTFTFYKGDITSIYDCSVVGSTNKCLIYQPFAFRGCAGRDPNTLLCMGGGGGGGGGVIMNAVNTALLPPTPIHYALCTLPSPPSLHYIRPALFSTAMPPSPLHQLTEIHPTTLWPHNYAHVISTCRSLANSPQLQCALISLQLNHIIQFNLSPQNITLFPSPNSSTLS